MSIDVEMREIKLDEIQKAINLHNSHFGENRTTEIWNWEYRGIYPDRYVFMVGIENDTSDVVLTQAMIPININIAGNTYFSGKSENSLLSSKLRGGSWFKDIYALAMDNCKNKGMSCVWGFTNLGKVWKNKLGFNVYDNFREDSILVIKPIKFFRDLVKAKHRAKFFLKLLISLVFLLIYPILSLKRCFVSTKLGNYSVKDSINNIDDLKSFYDAQKKIYPNQIVIDQDEKFIKWRISDNPTIDYKTLFMYEGENLKSYCYYNINKNNSVMITDFNFENTKHGSALLTHLIKLLRKEKTSYIYFWGNKKNEKIKHVLSLLKKFGALNKNRKDIYFVLKNISFGDEDFLYDITNWHLNPLWSEGISR